MIYKKNWKYTLYKDESSYCTIFNYYKLKALKEFGNVKEGDAGGYVRGYHNLSQFGDCWIYDDSIVFGYAEVSGNAQVKYDSKVFEYAKISDDARIMRSIISGDAKISGSTCCDGARIPRKDGKSDLISI